MVHEFSGIGIVSSILWLGSTDTKWELGTTKKNKKSISVNTEIRMRTIYNCSSNKQLSSKFPDDNPDQETLGEGWRSK